MKAMLYIFGESLYILISFSNSVRGGYNRGGAAEDTAAKDLALEATAAGNTVAASANSRTKSLATLRKRSGRGFGINKIKELVLIKL